MNTSLVFNNFSNNCQIEFESKETYRLTSLTTILLISLLILIGLIGNFYGAFYHIKFKLGNNISRIYIPIICITNGIFLLVHFFDDTLRTFIDVYLNPEKETECSDHGIEFIKKSYDEYFRKLNIVDNSIYGCRSINYLRGFLRFLSSYLIVLYTTQRTAGIIMPFYGARIESVSIARRSVMIIFFTGILINIWLPFMFNISNIDIKKGFLVETCNIHEEYSFVYFIFTIINFVLANFIPILIIFISNALLIIELIKTQKKKNLLLNESSMMRVIRKTLIIKDVNNKKEEPSYNRRVSILDKRKSSERRKYMEMVYESGDTMLRLVNYSKRVKKNRSNKSINRLICMSTCYLVLNMSYFICWSLFYYEMAIEIEINVNKNTVLFSAVSISKVFYVLNFVIEYLYLR